jgi:hypothetical protein
MYNIFKQYNCERSMNIESLYQSEIILIITYFFQEKSHSPTPLQFFRNGLLTVKYHTTHKHAVLYIKQDIQPYKISLTFQI